MAAVAASAIPGVRTRPGAGPGVRVSGTALILAAVAAGRRRQGPGPGLGVGGRSAAGLRVAGRSAAATARRDGPGFRVPVPVLKRKENRT